MTTKPKVLPVDKRALWLVPELFPGATKSYYQENNILPQPLQPYDWVLVTNTTNSLTEQTFHGYQGYITLIKYNTAQVQLQPGAYFFPLPALTKCTTPSTSTKMLK